MEISKDTCRYATANKSCFECFVGGSIENHVERHKFTDGRMTSFATEEEIQADAALYGMNIEERVEWLTNGLLTSVGYLMNIIPAWLHLTGKQFTCS